MKTRNHLLSALLAAALQIAVPAFAQDAPKAETLRPEIVKLVQEAQELVKAKQFPEALAKLKSADAIADRTPFENFTIERTRGPAASGAGDADLTADAFKKVIDSGRLPPAEQLQLTEGVAANFYNQKKYPQTIVWAQRFLASGGSSDNINLILLQSQFLSDDFASVTTALKAQVAADEKAGRPTTELRLQMLAESSRKQNDMAGYGVALEKLTQAYPKPTYWAPLLDRIQRQPGFSDRYTLDVLRLQRATGTLTTAADYTLMAELALQANLPAEASSVLEQGFAASLLGTGAQAAKHTKLRTQARNQAAADQKVLTESEAPAQKAASGTALVNIGTNYLGQKDYPRSISLIEQGIAKGGLKHPEEAKLHLGMALQLSGDKAKAASVLKSVQGRDGGADLARLWTYLP
ncbi:hypothetical protein RCH09_001787 [Actimicrobium sp. GrIS 1.19]|uniref:hypothetical protein n=1 Tax=Actimicrobium sp. GrIS 1.19 TaxID=3071708 RepID=UPI002E076D41|nr:hypothetical protein [Actimicrobium sp. GrIS 1.19]